MTNPYRDRPDFTIWRKAISGRGAADVDPIVDAPFTIDRADRVATAGSCFAQHMSRRLVQEGFNYFVPEQFAPALGVTDENYGVFSARFGNIYTVRQLVHLFDRAYGRFVPARRWLVGAKGEYLDPFRPRIQEAGFDSIDHLLADGERHLAAVRAMFEQCDVFVFTLGQTECWMVPDDGAVYPLAPGVCSPSAGPEAAVFHNFGVREVIDDLHGFISRFRGVNPAARILLTVSPVSMIATYEQRHVLVSTIATKSILRAAVDDVQRADPAIAYLPSYEAITGPQARGRFFDDGLREVTQAGVDHVMALFARHYLGKAGARVQERSVTLSEADLARMAEIAGVICDEEQILK